MHVLSCISREILGDHSFPAWRPALNREDAEDKALIFLIFYNEVFLFDIMLTH